MVSNGQLVHGTTIAPVRRLFPSDGIPLFSMDDDFVGVLHAHDPLVRTEILPHLDSGDLFCEFMALSVKRDHDAFRPLPRDNPGLWGHQWTLVDKKVSPLNPIPMLNIMLIGWTGKAPRIGLELLMSCSSSG